MKVQVLNVLILKVQIFFDIFPNLSQTGRPDILCRIFKMKLDNLMNELTCNGMLGKVQSGTEILPLLDLLS